MFQAFLSIITSNELLYAAIRLTAPLLLAALGGLFSERAGVINIALEGIMLSGALAGFLGSYVTGSPWLGLVIAMLAGTGVASILAFSAITLRTDQIVTAVAINILMLGVTGVIFRGFFGPTTSQVNAPSFSVVPIPLLSDLPVLGPLLFNHYALVYLAFLLVPVCHFVLYRTTWGLQIRAVGEHPRAADTLGVNVIATRWVCVLASGLLAATGGAILSIGYVNTFQENMTAGRGFIAFSAIVFGGWTPVGTLIASLLFGAADALQLRIQSNQEIGAVLPYQLWLMLPYVVTLLALFWAGRSKAPAAAGQAYVRE